MNAIAFFTGIRDKIRGYAFWPAFDRLNLQVPIGQVPLTKRHWIMIPDSIQKTIRINAPVSLVWKYLTKPELMKTWMGEAEMKLEIGTKWEVGGPIVIKGFHHSTFENKGTVLQFEPHKIIQYSHLSSLSRLPDKVENYSVITFQLSAKENQTLLSLQIENFPSETIYKHLYFYWLGTLEVMKRVVEK